MCPITARKLPTDRKHSSEERNRDRQGQIALEVQRGTTTSARYAWLFEKTDSFRSIVYVRYLISSMKNGAGSI